MLKAKQITFLMAALLAVTQQSQMKNKACEYKQFPIFAGGLNADKVYALEVKKINMICLVRSWHVVNFRRRHNDLT